MTNYRGPRGGAVPERAPVQQVESHHDLVVWQKAMDLAAQVYRLTEILPAREATRLTAQILGAAAAVPAQIADGHARGNPRDFAGSLSNARASLAETETYLLLATRLGYFTESQTTLILNLLAEVTKMLGALRKRLLSSESR